MKHFYIIVDTETTRRNTVADFGAVLVTRKGEIVEQFGAMVWEPIPQATIWQEAESRARSVYSLDPNCDAAGHVWEMCDRVEEVVSVR